MGGQWGGVTPRFAVYCVAHGAQNAAEMIAVDGARFPGGKMAGFMLWIGQQWREWQRETGHRGAKSRADHAAFDAWLWRGELSNRRAA